MCTDDNGDDPQRHHHVGITGRSTERRGQGHIHLELNDITLPVSKARHRLNSPRQMLMRSLSFESGLYLEAASGFGISLLA